VWIVRGANSATILLTNFALPRHPIAAQVVRISLRNTSAPIRASIQRIDQQHANAKRHWQELGEPEYPNPKLLAQLHAASALRREVHAFRHSGDVLELDVDMPPLGVAAVTLEFSAAA
jgi:xylan 1,4-beta-xylosidase